MLLSNRTTVASGAGAAHGPSVYNVTRSALHLSVVIRWQQLVENYRMLRTAGRWEATHRRRLLWPVTLRSSLLPY
jgi:hypothetical protein